MYEYEDTKDKDKVSRGPDAVQNAYVK